MGMGSDESHLIQLGQKVVTDGSLKTIRGELGISVAVQAHMIGIQPIMIGSWESGKNRPSARSAVKVANWFTHAKEVLDSLAGHPVRSGELLHVSLASEQLGISYATITDWCQRNLIECVDLGTLGLYVRREQVMTLPTERGR